VHSTHIKVSIGKFAGDSLIYKKTKWKTLSVAGSMDVSGKAEKLFNILTI
jgi:hypothetical protein